MLCAALVSVADRGRVTVRIRQMAPGWIALAPSSGAAVTRCALKFVVGLVRAAGLRGHYRSTYDWVATQPRQQPFCSHLPGMPQGYRAPGAKMMELP